MTVEVPKLLLDMARHRVAQGVKWLDKRAKYDPRFRGWRLQMMSIHGGIVYSRVHMMYDSENPLALALKWESSLASGFSGRVEWAIVKNKFGFVGPQGSLHAQNLGFHEGNHQTSSWFSQSDRILYCNALDIAWREALGEYTTALSPNVYEYVEPPKEKFFARVRRWFDEDVHILFGS